MPILPAHVGPPVLIGALAGKKLNMTVLITVSLVIDIEALFWGIMYDEHGYLHTFAGGALFGILYGVLFFNLMFVFWKWQDRSNSGIELYRNRQAFRIRDWSNSYKCIIISSMIGAYTHIALDWLIYDNIRVFALNDSNLYYTFTSVHRPLAIVLTHGICLVCFITGLFLLKFRKMSGKTRTYQVDNLYNFTLDDFKSLTMLAVIMTPFVVAGLGAFLFAVFFGILFPNDVLPSGETGSILFLFFIAIIIMIIGFYRAIKKMGWKLWE